MPDVGRLLARYSERRDPRTFAALFDATAPNLFRVALRLAPDALAAEDAVQETFLFVLEHAGRYDPERPALPWMLGVLKRKVQEARRRAGRAPDPFRVRPPLAPPGPADAAHRREETECLRRALDALPEPYRGVGLLRWRHGLEPAEIAELRGEPPSTVRATLSRALKRLRAVLGSIAALTLLGGAARGLPGVRSALLSHRSLIRGVWMFRKLSVAAVVLVGLLTTWWAVSETNRRDPARARHARAQETPPKATTALVAETNGVTVATYEVRVSVRTLDDRPLANARVTAIRPTASQPVRALYDPSATRAVHVEVATDRAGRARLAGLKPGHWAFEAAADGYAIGRVSRTVRGHGEIVFHLGAGYELHGTVLETDGTAVAGVRVSSGAAWTVSDAQGLYRLEALPWGAAPLKAARPGGVALEVARVRVPDVQRFDLVLDPAAILAGRVTDADTGKPLKGVRVRAGIYFGYQGAGEAMTGSDGRYAIHTLREGVVNQLGATLDGYFKAAPRDRRLRIPMRGHETTVRDIEMRRAALPRGAPQITGRVLGPDGPLAGARVVAGSRRAVTNAEGVFELRGLDKGPVVLRAAYRGHYQETPIRADPGTSIDLRLLRGKTLTGRVESIGGEPLAGALVGTAIADEQGDFVIDGIIPGIAPEFHVTCDGYVRTTLKAGFESKPPLLVRMTPAPRVSGVVTATGGASLRGAYVQVFVVTGRMRRRPGGGKETLKTPPVPVRGDGAYEAEIPWAKTGTFRVEVRSPEHRVTVSKDLRLAPGRRSYAVDVELQAGAIVTGQVVEDGTLRPLPGVSVSVGEVVRAVTDRDGCFQMRTRTNPTLDLSAHGYVSRHVQGSGPFALEPALEIRGRVEQEDGRPVIAADVRAQGPFTAFATTDDRGEFRLRGLGRGEYTVRLQDPGIPHDPVAGVRPEGVAVRLVVREPAAVRGRILDEQRRPLGGIVVRAGSVRTVTRRDGTFELKVSGASEYTLSVNPGSTSPYQQGRDYLSERRMGVRAGDAPVEFVLKRGFAIAGHLLDEGGQPLAGVWLALAGKTVTTSAEGAFVFRGVPEGEHDLHLPLSHNKRGWRLLHAARIRAGTSGVQLVARAGRTLRGHVVDETGQAIAGAKVLAVAPNGSARRARTGRAGTFEITGVHGAPVNVTVAAEGYEKAVLSAVAAGNGDLRIVMRRP